MSRPEDPATAPASAASTEGPSQPAPPQLQLSVIQVVGTAAAAVTAAVLCSFLGVVGTVVGTAVTSIVVTSGGALYQHSLRRTRVRLQRLHAANGSLEPMTVALARARLQRRGIRRDIPWRIVALGTANVFVFAIALITGIEGALGSSLAAEFGVGHSGSGGTSLGSTLGIHHHRHHATPATTPTPTASSSPRSTSTSTSPSPSPSAVSPTPTVSTTVTPSGGTTTSSPGSTATPGSSSTPGQTTAP